MDSEPVRVDRWLWATRLVKTRALAAEAAAGGRVHVNGTRAKPSKEVRPGDEIELTVGPLRRTVVVLGTAPRRGPAKDSQRLYEETAESVARREEQAAQRRADAHLEFPGGYGRPTKRDRRRLDAMRKGQGRRP